MGATGGYWLSDLNESDSSLGCFGWSEGSNIESRMSIEALRMGRVNEQNQSEV